MKPPALTLEQKAVVLGDESPALQAFRDGQMRAAILRGPKPGADVAAVCDRRTHCPDCAALEQRVARLERALCLPSGKPNDGDKIERIKLLVAVAFGISVPSIASGKRCGDVNSKARCMGFKLIREFVGSNDREIAAAFGGFNRSAIAHGILRFASLMYLEESFRAKYEAIKTQLTEEFK